MMDLVKLILFFCIIGFLISTNNEMKKISNVYINYLNLKIEKIKYERIK